MEHIIWTPRVPQTTRLFLGRLLRPTQYAARHPKDLRRLRPPFCQWFRGERTKPSVSSHEGIPENRTVSGHERYFTLIANFEGIFRLVLQICNSEAVWRVIYKKKIKRRVLLSDIEKGTEIGWKQALKSKIMSRVTLRNLLDKNEGKMRPSSAAAQQKNQMNNLTSSTTPNIISKKPSVPNVSRVMTNPNTSISNRSSTNLIKNPRDIPQEGGRRYTKSAVSLQKSTISSKIDTRDHAKSCLGIQKDAIPERELTLPINKTKLLQSSATVRSGSGEKNLNNDLDGLLGKANRTFQTKFEKSLNKSYMVGKKGANKK